MSSGADILVIDDEQVVLSAIAKLLSLEGLSSDGALSGKAALDKLANTGFRLILTDLMLPDISGLELIQLIAERWPSTPLIAMSGYATAEKAVETIRRGAFDFLPKPFDSEELLGVIDRANRYASPLARQRPVDRRYHFGIHSWAELGKDGFATIGAGESFFGTLGAVELVDLPEVNEGLIQGAALARIEAAAQHVHTVCSPLSGRVIERNPKLMASIGLIDTDPFCDGWLVRMIPTDLDGELPRLSSKRAPDG